MKVLVELEFSADGYLTEDEELACLKPLLEDCDSAAISIRVLKIEKIECAHNYQPTYRKWETCTKCGDKQ